MSSLNLNRRKITIIAIVIVAVFVLIGLGRQVIGTLEAVKRLDRVADEVSSLQEKNRKLQEQYGNIQKYESIEEIARNNLNYAKPEETIIIIPEKDIEGVINSRKPVSAPKISNWEGWLRLFFH